MKILFFLGTRPEIIKSSSLIKLLKKNCDCIVVHTNQNFSNCLKENILEDVGITPDIYLNCKDDSLGTTIGNVISKSFKLIEEEKPDCVLIYGDTNSGMAGYCSKRLHIPFIHLEGGMRCFDDDTPEEINRRILDHIADINIVHSEFARRNLLNEGIRNEKIYNLKSPMFEVIYEHMGKIVHSKILEKVKVETDDYILVSIHREENMKKIKHIVKCLKSVYDKFHKKMIMTLHPRTKKHLKKLDFIEFFEPFNFTDYCHLEMNAFVVISDSGTLAEECGILGFYGVHLRTSTEREEVYEKGNFIRCFSPERIIDAIVFSRRYNDYKQNNNEFENPDYSKDVLKLLLSFV